MKLELARLLLKKIINNKELIMTTEFEEQGWDLLVKYCDDIEDAAKFIARLLEVTL